MKLNSKTLVKFYVFLQLDNFRILPSKICPQCNTTITLFHQYLSHVRWTNSQLNRIDLDGKIAENETIVFMVEQEDEYQKENFSLRGKIEIDLEEAEEGESDWEKVVEEFKCPVCRDVYVYVEKTKIRKKNYYQVDCSCQRKKNEFESERRIRGHESNHIGDAEQTQRTSGETVSVYTLKITSSVDERGKICEEDLIASLIRDVTETNPNDEKGDISRGDLERKGRMDEGKSEEEKIKNSSEIRIKNSSKTKVRNMSEIFKMKFKESEKINNQMKKRNRKCEICEEIFENKLNLLKHLKSHEGTFTCKHKDCRKVCKSAYALNYHEKKHEANEKICQTCGKSFRFLSYLKNHERTHSEKKDFNCADCGRSFYKNSTLQMHVKTHHEGKRFFCSICPKSFLTHFNLQRHEIVHAGVRKYICERCPGAFYTEKELTRHKRRNHLGIKKHVCEYCQKGFFEKTKYRIHLRTHTGERPFVCGNPGCEKAYFEKSHLKSHRRGCNEKLSELMELYGITKDELESGVARDASKLLS